MSPGEWSDGSALAIALYLDGSDGPDRAADGTPLLDIKPYLKSTDCEPDSTMGWLEQHATQRP